jgi:hypothetical protein
MIQEWEKVDSKPIEIHQWMQRYEHFVRQVVSPRMMKRTYLLLDRVTLDALGRAIFNLDFEALKPDEENELVRTYHKTVDVPFCFLDFCFFFSPVAASLIFNPVPFFSFQIFSNPMIILFPTLSSFLYKNVHTSMNRFDEILGEMIDGRRKEVVANRDQTYKDLISLMIQAEMNDDDTGPKMTREEFKVRTRSAK